MSIEKKTYVYKTVGECKICADVYKKQSNDIQPVILWLHGGALINGTRLGIQPSQLELYVNKGYTVVSADYRLAPEVKIDEIIKDIQDVYNWIRNEGQELFKADPDRIAVVGHSAGGYLTLMMGFCVTPRPRALVSFYGYGDVAGEWYSRPSVYHSQNGLVSKDEAYKIVYGSVISETDKDSDRTPFYRYCRQNGIWPLEVIGYDPDMQPEAFIPYCPLQNVTKDYSPTYLLHGDNDPGVPAEQSVMMSEELTRKGVVNKLYIARNGRHGFDKGGDRGVEADVLKEIFDSVLSFLEDHLT